MVPDSCAVSAASVLPDPIAASGAAVNIRRCPRDCAALAGGSPDPQRYPPPVDSSARATAFLAFSSGHEGKLRHLPRWTTTSQRSPIPSSTASTAVGTMGKPSV